MTLSSLLRRSAILAAGVALAATATAEAQGQGGGLRPEKRMAYATDGTQLVGFRANKPEQLQSIGSIQGLASGARLVGIDFRPATGDLYGIGSDSCVYRINPQTRIAIAENLVPSPTPGAPPVCGAFTPGLNGTAFGVDFNPVPDAIRLVSDADQNQRIAPDAGTTLGVDMALNPAGQQVAGAAYTNSTFSATRPTATQLFVVSYGQDTVYLQNPPNNGTLTNGQPLFGLDVQPQFGWDIAGARNLGYLATSDRRGRTNTLYTVDPTTGNNRSVGQIGGRRLRGFRLTGLAISQDALN